MVMVIASQCGAVLVPSPMLSWCNVLAMHCCRCVTVLWCQLTRMLQGPSDSCVLALWACDVEWWRGMCDAAILAYFLCKAFDSLFMLRNSRQHFSTTLGGHFRQWNHQKKKAQKCKRKCGTKQTVERTLVCSTRVETRRQSNNLTTAGRVYKFFSNSSPLCTCSQMTWK